MSAVPASPPRDPLSILIEKIDNLAVLPHVVFKVLEVSASEDAPPMELERAIIIDPGFSSKVLTLANSAYFGLPRKVTSIREAILFLGFRQVRNLAMTVGAYDMFVGKNDKESLRRRAWWKLSVDSAVACKWISFSTKQGNPDDAYTCGLLHLIGKTLLERFGAGDYERVRLMVNHGISELQAEEKAYGCNHVQVALGAAQRWGFPPALTSGLSYVEAIANDEAHAIPAAITAVGAIIARRFELGKTPDNDATLPALPLWALEILNVPAESADQLAEQGMLAIGTAQLHLG